MNCEEIRPLLAAWLDGELAQDTSREVETHVAPCKECGGIANSYRDMQQTFHAADQAVQVKSSDAGQDDASLWQNIQLQIQAEESAALRRELEQMRQMVHGLQREVSELRRQVNNTPNPSPLREMSCFNALLPGTPPGNQSTNLRALL